MGKKDKQYNFWVEYWVLHRERSLEHKWYAIGRIDLLTISISAGGIYVVLEIIKYIADNNLIANLLFLKISGVWFLMAVITNFISQFCGYRANKHESIFSKYQIKKALGKKLKTKEKLLRSGADEKVKFYNKAVSISNVFSYTTMLIGLVLLVYFICATF